MARKFFTSFTLTDGSVVDEGLGKNRVKVIGTDTAQQYFIREVIVSHLGGGSVDVVKDNKVFSVNAQLEKLSKQRAEQVYVRTCTGWPLLASPNGRPTHADSSYASRGLQTFLRQSFREKGYGSSP